MLESVHLLIIKTQELILSMVILNFKIWHHHNRGTPINIRWDHPCLKLESAKYIFNILMEEYKNLYTLIKEYAFILQSDLSMLLLVHSFTIHE